MQNKTQVKNLGLSQFSVYWALGVRVFKFQDVGYLFKEAN